MRMLLVVCLLALPGLPAVASDSDGAAHCSREAGVKLLSDPELQAYFAAHRAIEAELGL
ncbi:MAG: hypothetical protein ACYCZR_16020 [Burkholderiales bacterium]